MRFLILIILIISIPTIYFSNKSREKDTRQYKVDFMNYLKAEKFYFTGKIIYTKLIDHGGGFICLDQITTNKPSGYELKLDKNYAVIVNDNKTIKFIGHLYFNYNYNEKSDKLKLGDSISFNFDNNGRIKAYRDKELLYDQSAFIYKVQWCNRILNYKCQ